MPKYAYIDKHFRSETYGIISNANVIINEYSERGYDLTLRQLYYQFVARNIFKNTERNYKKLGAIVSDARLAGFIDWNAIVDRTRFLRSSRHWTSPEERIRKAAAEYEIDKWGDQAFRPEVWIEKDALIGVISKVCYSHDVPFFSCRGYVSQSAMWRAGQRLLRHFESGQEPCIIHLGDHDPSGLDMSRDIDDRMHLFCGTNLFEIHRIALNMDQVTKYNPPPNPARIKDSRYKEYLKNYGNDSWELDALNPEILSDLVEARILDFKDNDAWEVSVEQEEEHREYLLNLIDPSEE